MYVNPFDPYNSCIMFFPVDHEKEAGLCII